MVIMEDFGEINNRMNLNEPYLQNLLSHSTELKTEEDHDYTATQMPFINTEITDFSYSQMQLTQSPVAGMFSSPTNSIPNFTVTRGLGSASGRFTFSMAPGSGNPHIATNAIEQLPDTTIFPGEYVFELSFGPQTDGATKSADFTFSYKLSKLYVQRGAHCPFKFKTRCSPPSNSYVRILPVFKGTHVLSEPVRRCSNHAEGDDEGPRYHFIRANNRNTQYSTTEGGRLFLTVPYTGPQVGAEYQVELLSFQCFNSCGHSSHSKRRIDVIFTLESEGHVLGRQVIEVRVCACPGRDRSNEEGSFHSSKFQAVRRGSLSGSVLRAGKKRKLSSPTTMEEDYVIRTKNPVVFQLLTQMLPIFESALPMTDLAIRDGPSPVSSASSPGNVFRPLPELESGTDEE